MALSVKLTWQILLILIPSPHIFPAPTIPPITYHNYLEKDLELRVLPTFPPCPPPASKPKKKSWFLSGVAEVLGCLFEDMSVGGRGKWRFF